MCKHGCSMYVPKIELDKGGRNWMFLFSISTLVWVFIQSSINPLCFCPLCGIHEWTLTLILHLKYAWVQGWEYRRQLTSVSILLMCSVSPDLCFWKNDELRLAPMRCWEGKPQAAFHLKKPSQVQRCTAVLFTKAQRYPWLFSMFIYLCFIRRFCYLIILHIHRMLFGYSLHPLYFPPSPASSSFSFKLIF